MKTIFITFLMLSFFLFIFHHEEIYAQTGYWKLAGNNLTGTEKIGSLNNFDFKMITNNSTRMTVKANGRVGIGTTNPSVKLHVTGGSSAKASGGGFIVAGSTNGQNLAIDENGLVSRNNGTYSSMYLNAAQVVLGANGGNAVIGGGLASANLYLDKDEIQSRNNGAPTTLQLNPAGGLVQTGGGIRISRAISGARFFEFISTAANQNDVRLEHSSAGSFLYFSSSTNDFASFTDLARFDLATSPTYVLSVYGNALASGGMWINSDLKLKKDINNIDNATDIVKSLRPRTYFYKKDEYKSLNFSSHKQYGFVAQELEEVLPDLVQVSKQPTKINEQGERELEEVKSINYNGLISILTRAIQEQEQKITDQDKKIEELSVLVNQLLMASKESIPTAISNNTLNQNSPNPFKRMTVISYTLPKKFTNAQIVITDNTSKMLKQINISGENSGAIHIDGTTLPGGTYNYTLYGDGKLISSKQMIVVK